MFVLPTIPGMNRRRHRPAASARRVLALLPLGLLPGPSPLVAQDPPRADPGSVELAADGARVEVALQGPTAGMFRGARVLDRNGVRAPGLDVDLGALKGDIRPLVLTTKDAQPGEYGVWLEGERGPVEVALRITVTAPPLPVAPPEIVTARAPASVETGAALPVAVVVRGSAALASLEWAQDGRRNEVRLAGGTEAREELRLEAPARPGPVTVRLVAVDRDGRRSAPREVVVDVVEPPPAPRIDDLRLEPVAVAAGDPMTLRLRLNVPASEPLEIAFTGQLLHNGIVALPPATATIPVGVQEIAVPVTFTDGRILPGAHPFTLRAELNGSAHSAQGSVVGIPYALRISTPTWVMAGEEVTVEIELSDPAPPGGLEVEVRIPQVHNYTQPWGAVLIAPEGETRFTASTTLQRDQATPVQVSWAARTAAHGTEVLPALATHMLHARPRLQTLNLLQFHPISEASRWAVAALAGPAPPGGVEVALEVEPAGFITVPASVTIQPNTTSAGFQVHLLEAPTGADVDVVIRGTVMGEVVERTVTVAGAGG